MTEPQPHMTFGNAPVTGASSGKRRIARAVNIAGKWAAEVSDGGDRILTRSNARWKSRELALQVAIKTAKAL